MIKKTFILLTGEVDGQNDKINLDGIKFPASGKLPIYSNFEHHTQVGTAGEFKKVKNTIEATGEFDVDPTGLVPAICFTANKMDFKDGVFKIHDITLHSVSLCKANIYPNVPPIK